MRSEKQKKNQAYIYRHYRKPYPNAADPIYFTDRLVDGIVSVITVLGTVSFFLFLVTM